MRLVSLLLFLLSSTGLAVSVEVVLDTPREVNQMVHGIFDDDEEEAIEDLVQMAAQVRLANVGELTTPEGAHIEWDTGNEGDRFVRFRAPPGLVEEAVPNTLGEILAGGYVPGSPFFYFIVRAPNGHHSLYLFGFRERFILVTDLGQVDFEVADTGLFEGNPEQLYLVIRRGENLRAFYWTRHQTLPLICPDLEEGMTIRRVGRVVGTTALQSFWIIDIDRHPHLFIDSEEVNMDDWEFANGGMCLKVQPLPQPQQDPAPAAKKRFWSYFQRK